MKTSLCRSRRTVPALWGALAASLAVLLLGTVPVSAQDKPTTPPRVETKLCAKPDTAPPLLETACTKEWDDWVTSEKAHAQKVGKDEDTVHKPHFVCEKQIHDYYAVCADSILQLRIAFHNQKQSLNERIERSSLRAKIGQWIVVGLGLLATITAAYAHTNAAQDANLTANPSQFWIWVKRFVRFSNVGAAATLTAVTAMIAYYNFRGNEASERQARGDIASLESEVEDSLVSGSTPVEAATPPVFEPLSTMTVYRWQQRLSAIMNHDFQVVLDTVNSKDRTGK
jgi:hypothetical protein